MMDGRNDDFWPMVVVQWVNVEQPAETTWIYREHYEPETQTILTMGWVWPNCIDGHITIVSSVVGLPDDPDFVGHTTHIPSESIEAVYSLTTHLPQDWFSDEL